MIRRKFLGTTIAGSAEAKRHNATIAQVAIAWLLQKSPVMLPIPGTSSVPHLEENLASAKLQLTPTDWKTIESLAEPRLKGARALTSDFAC
jgi:aryl-alcohol dehydrogenase-like predicted oxidoreductase